jgi:Leucine-rich repeat (LRR) protein
MRSTLLVFALFLVSIPGHAVDSLAWISEAGGVVSRNAQGDIFAIDLRASWAGDSDLAPLANIRTLRRLDISETRIGDHGLRQLKNAPAVSELNLRYAELITDQGVSALKNWKQIIRLNLQGTKITDSALLQLSALTSLEALNIGSVQVTDAGIEALASLVHLKELTLGGNKLTDAGLQPLRQMPGLTFLDLGGVQRTDSGPWSVSFGQSGLEAIATLRSLRRLRLSDTGINARGIEVLKRLPLESLDLHDCNELKDDAIPILARIRTLHFLDLSGTKVSATEVTKLRRMRPDCRIIFIPTSSRPKAEAEEP